MCEIRCWVTSGLQLLWPLKKILTFIFSLPYYILLNQLYFQFFSSCCISSQDILFSKLNWKKKELKYSHFLDFYFYVLVENKNKKQKESPTRGSSQLVSFICTCIYSLCSIKYWDWMRGWLLFNANSLIFQLYHHKNKLIFNEMIMRSALY